MAVTAIILTRNEEVHLGRCLERIARIADRFIVVDSFSTDRTQDIARKAGAEVWEHPFANHAAQFNWALDRLGGGRDDWILRVDADEWFEPAALDALRRRIAAAPKDLVAFEFRRKVVFQGRWIRWGGYSRTILTRAWRIGAARVEPRLMDEHVIVDHGRIERIREGDLVDENLKDLTDWTAKHNGYTTRQMVEFIRHEYRLAGTCDETAGLNRHARRKRSLRNGLYSRAPLFLRASLYFGWRYFLRLGFLDGRPGLVFHTLQGFWNFFLVDAKIDEARQYIAKNGLDAFREHLRQDYQIELGIIGR